jgi:hypothetical protein
MTMKYDTKKENQFERTAIREIRKKRNTLLDGVGLVHTIENLREDEYVELPASLQILPIDCVDAKYFIKRGRHLNIPIPESKEEAYKERKGMLARIKERMEDAKGVYRGYGWTGLKSDRHKLFTLSDNIEGVEIYAASLENLTKCGIKIKDYGRRCIAHVSSRRERRRYKVDLMSLPVDDLHHADILDIEASCNCEENAFHGKLNYKYSSGEDRFCSHAVAAYLAVAQQKAESEKPAIRQSPIPIPSKKMVRFSDKLDNNVIRDRITGKGEERATNVSKVEKEILLWKYLEEHGPAECFIFDNTARIDVYAASCYAIAE